METTFHRERRRRFLKALPPRSLALFPAAPVAVRSLDVEYPYRPDSDLFYLTGFPEPGGACLLDNGSEAQFVLFVLPRDPQREIWTGTRFGVDGAREIFGADAAYSIEQFDEIFGRLLDEREQLFFAFGRDESWNRRVLDHVRRSQASRPYRGMPGLAVRSPAEVLHEMRLRKDPEELASMRRAAEITEAGHREAHRAARPGAAEYEVEAALEAAFRRLGGSGPAYPSIVASGPNATVLHYSRNSRRMEEGDLLLIDAGAEYGCYASDVTRTFPVGRRFTAEQRAVYGIVLAAQQAAIALARPGATLEDLHRAAVRVLVEGLRDLGVLALSTEEAIEKEAYRPFYMHRTSHWLGMDVHDVGRYRNGDRPRPLEPGMVFTVEPGLYFRATDVQDRFAGIGVRIEDDLLVTPEGHEVLTRAIPKEPADLEELRREVLG
jgi:Xaa-Pro aminopeptidase